MTGLSTTSETANAIAPGGAISKVAQGLESLFMFHPSDRPKGESEMNHLSGRKRVGGLVRVSAAIHSVGRHSLLFGKTVAHRGVGRSAPNPFLEFHRDSNGGMESGGSDRLGPVSMD